MALHTHMFDQKVRDALAPAASVLREDATIQDAWSVCRANDLPQAVVHADGGLAGIVTCRDVLDWLARGLDTGERIGRLLLTRQLAVPGELCLFDALVTMRRARASALPVTDAGGKFIGMITILDIFNTAVSPVFALAQAATSGDERVALAQLREGQVSLADELLLAGVASDEVLSALSGINAYVHRAVTRLLIQDLEQDGWGSPPVPYALIVMGSGGRGESNLGTDQDNALIIADHDERDRLAIESYFIAFSERLTKGLAAAGLPLCKGNVMATSPVWRKSLSEWYTQMRQWVLRREPMHLLNTDVMIDMAHVVGECELSSALRQRVLALVTAEPDFVHALYRIEESHGVALDWLGRLAREEDAIRGDRGIDMKLRGTLPLVEGARLASLKHGVDALSTLARLEGLAARGAISRDTGEDLKDAFRTLSRMILRQQIEDSRKGVTLRGVVDTSLLARRDKAELQQALNCVSRFRNSLPSLIGA